MRQPWSTCVAHQESSSLSLPSEEEEGEEGEGVFPEIEVSSRGK